MKLKKLFSSQSGNTIIEAVFTLSILAMVIAVLFTLVSIVLLSRQISADVFTQGSELVSIQDEAAYKVKSNADKSPLSVSETIAAVISKYPKWRCEIEPVGNGLFHVFYIFTGEQGERSYESHIFAGTP